MAIKRENETNAMKITVDVGGTAAVRSISNINPVITDEVFNTAASGLAALQKHALSKKARTSYAELVRQ